MFRSGSETSVLCATSGTISDRSSATSISVLLILSLISLLSYYDRFLLTILVEAIKKDLRISDPEIGLLTGIGFALIYSLLGVPVARYADGGRRVPVLGVSLLVWSAMTLACGLAASFPMMILARLGVGLGEAGSIPVVQALVSEHFKGRWQGTALTVVVAAGGLGVLLANSFGGWIADHWGWRAAFWVGAAPAPILALLLWWRVPEPAVALRSAGIASRKWRVLVRRRSFACLCIGAAMGAVFSMALQSWAPAFLMRRFELTASAVGVGYGLIAGLVSMVTLLASGMLGTWLARRDTRWLMWLPMIGFGLTIPSTFLFLYAESYVTVLIVTPPLIIFCTLVTSPAYLLIQLLSGPQYRATGPAIYLLAINLIGLGAGPSVTGWLSGALGEGDMQSLRQALGIITFVNLAAILILAAGVPSLKRDIAGADAL